MRPPAPDELLKRIHQLPAARPLFPAVGDDPRVYLVGGAVRDLLLGGAPADLDLAVDGDPAWVAYRISPGPVTHDRFGTATAAAQGHVYDLARTRRETYARPGALPDVAPAGIEEDLRRRDFTVNAVATALAGPWAGELLAFPGALDDLSERTLRVLHPGSFVDDPTRLLRLARYRSRLGFAIDPATRALAQQAIATGALATVSGPRVGNELRLLAREADPVAALRALRELGLDEAIQPGFGLEDEESARRALELLPPGERADRLILAAAALRIPSAELRELLDRLGFEAGDRDAIISAAGAAELGRALSAARRPSEIAAAASGAEPEGVALAGALGAEAAARDWFDRLRSVSLEIDGRDLLEAGVPEGPAVGEALAAALAAKLDGRANGRDAELAAALESLRHSG